MVPAREGLTTVLVSSLREALALAEPPAGLGDGIAPEDWGWPNGQPGIGQFAPYAVLKTSTASQQRNRDNLSPQNDAWLFPYSITSWGSMRAQADYVADLVTAAIAALDVRALRGDGSPVPGFGVQQIHVDTIGTTDRTDQSAPALWSRTDSLSVWLARARAR